MSSGFFTRSAAPVIALASAVVLAGANGTTSAGADIAWLPESIRRGDTLAWHGVIPSGKIMEMQMPGVQPGQRIAGDSALVRDAWPPVAARRQTPSRGPASSVDEFLCGGPAIHSEVQVGARAGSLRFVIAPSRPVDLQPRSANVLNHKHFSLGFQWLERFTRQASQVRTQCRPPASSDIVSADPRPRSIACERSGIPMPPRRDSSPHGSWPIRRTAPSPQAASMRPITWRPPAAPAACCAGSRALLHYLRIPDSPPSIEGTS